ncbi:hypothetical protein KKI24_24450 [bacterium]|nr:hypothetical protein [bacterium]
MIKLKQLWIILLLAILFAVCALTWPFSTFAAECGMTDYAQVADAGLTLLEQILILAGVSGGGLAFVLIRIARGGVKTLLKSLDSNPYVNNAALLVHAKKEGDKKALKLFQGINGN